MTASSYQSVGAAKKKKKLKTRSGIFTELYDA